MNRRQVLTTTGAVASLGLCASIVAGAPGCTAAPAAEPDPLVPVLATYRAHLDAYNAASLPDDEAEDALMAVTWMPVRRRIEDDCPAPTTAAGAAAAIRAAMNPEMGDFELSPFAESLLNAALSYLDGRA